MAGAWCLPPKLANAFLEAIRSGELEPAKLMDMASAERRALFGKYVGAENATEVNAQFESKMLLQDQKRGMINWVNKTAGLTESARRDILTQIQKLERVLQPEDAKSFLADLAEKKLGVAVTADEARTIYELSKKAQLAKADAADSFSGVSDEFLNATEDLKAYISSLKPISVARSIGMNAIVVARNNLLFNPSTPIKTMIGQVENTAIEGVVRRIAAKSLNGLNGDLAKTARNEAWETYRKTGLNVAGMEALNDIGRLGEGRRFDAQGGSASTNAILRVAQHGMQRAAAVSNKIIIDWAHVAPFTRAYQQTFYDMANIISSNIAKGEGLAGEAARARAEEIFRDASKIEPKTREGAIARQMSQQQSARVTSTNDTVAARFAMGVKDALNKACYGLGDALMPVAKIPANIIWNGIENAGAGIPLGVRDIFVGRRKIQSADLATRYEGMAQYAKGIQTVARTFGSVAVSFYLASQLLPGDFRKDNFGKSFVRIGNVWINTEYISAISPSLAGAMATKMNANPGESGWAKVANYIGGASSALKEAPGADEVASLIDSIGRMGKETGFKKYAEDFFTSRAAPAFISHLFKDNPVERLFFGAHGVETDDQVRHDKFDRAMHHGPSGLSVWGAPLSRDDKSDPVNQELEQIGYVPSYPMQRIRGVKLSADQYQQYVEQSGRLAHMRLGDIIKMSGWDMMPMRARLNVVHSTINKARDMAATTIMLQSQGSSNDIPMQAAAAKMAVAPEPVAAQ